MLRNRRSIGILGAIALSIAFPFGPSSLARNWNANTANWNTASNWNPVGVPIAGDTVNIVNTDGTARTVTLDVTTPSLALTTIDLTGPGTAANTLSILNNFNFTSGALFVGGHNGATTTTGRGAVNQSAGAVAMSAGTDLAVGHGANSTGVYTLNNGTFTAPQSEFIGYGGTGTFNQFAGVNTINAGAIGSFNMGALASGKGFYNLNGGQLNSSKSEYIGDAGQGNFTHTGGTNTISGASNNLVLGFAAGSVGAYTINNSAALSVANNILVGQSGTGTLTIQDNSTVSAGNNVSVGTSGTLNLNGGTLRLNTYTPFANSTLNYTAGTVQFAGPRVIGSDTTVMQFFAGSNFIFAGKGLAVEGVLDLNANATVTGGKLQAMSNLRIGSLAGNSVTTVNINNGGLVTAGGDTLVGTTSTSGSVINIDGAGSSFSAPFNFQLGSSGNGTLNVTGGGTISTNNAALGNSSTNSIGTATLDGAGSKWLVANNLTVGVLGGSTSTLNIQTGALARAGGALTINATGVVNVNGGTLAFNTLADPGNKLQFNTGTIQLVGDRNLNTDSNVARFFGGPIPTIGVGKGLAIEGAATIPTGLLLQGGTLRVNSLTAPALFFNSGVLELTGGSLALPNGLLAVPAGGEFRATGTIGQRIVGAAGSIITATGNLTIGIGNTLGFYTNGGLNVGANSVTLLDANDAVFDSGSYMSIGNFGATPGSLSAANGLTIDFGSNFGGYGTITTPNSITTPLINNGHISGFNTAALLTLTGYVKGVGTFNNVNFTGTYSPGLSPTTVIAGSLSFSSTNTLIMELGGTTAGSGYDQILASGALALGGVLDIDLINGFTPAAGNSFDLFNWDSLSGTFSSLSLPALTGGLTWNTSQLYTTGVLSVIAAGLTGDFNNNGVVDTADYVVWRNNVGTSNTLPNDPTGGTIGNTQYNIWRSHFGQTAGIGSGSAFGSAVPEPCSAHLLFLVTLTMISRVRTKR